MAFDKVIDSEWLNAGLKKVCDAIRGKTGGTADLAFPDEMAAQVEVIETGGSLETVQITVRLLAGPIWRLAYSCVNTDGEIENVVYRGGFGAAGGNDTLAPFEQSGDYVVGVLDIPKGTVLAIGDDENMPLNFRGVVKCSVFDMEYANVAAVAIYDIADGASLTAYI